MNTEPQISVTTTSLAERPKTTIACAPGAGLQLSSLDDFWRFAGIILASGMAPKGMQSRESICVAIQMGMEVGLSPMSALQNIAVINGRPSIWGDSMLGICRATRDLEKFEEWLEHKGVRVNRWPQMPDDSTTAVCLLKRKGYAEALGTFSVAEAKLAGLWGKDGPWKQYPSRMLKFRARGWVLRDQFGDALKGIRSVEEMIGATIDVETTTGTPDIPKGWVFELKPEVGESTQHPETPQDAPAPQGDTSTPPEAEKPAQTDPGAEKTPQDTLADLIVAEGYSFDQWQGWALEAGFIDQEVGGFAEVPTVKAARALGSKRGMLAQLRVWVAGKGGAK